MGDLVIASLDCIARPHRRRNVAVDVEAESVGLGDAGAEPVRAHRGVELDPGESAFVRLPHRRDRFLRRGHGDAALGLEGTGAVDEHRRVDGREQQLAAADARVAAQGRLDQRSRIAAGGHADRRQHQALGIGRDVHVRVPDAGHQRLAPAVDHARAGRDRYARGRSDGGDAPTLRDDRLISEKAAGLGIEQAHAGERDRLGRNLTETPRKSGAALGERRLLCRLQLPARVRIAFREEGEREHHAEEVAVRVHPHRNGL
ncbi:MAG: hypothetical protein ACXWUR_04050, partial [Allosphingosinicella sp.]